MPRTTRSNELLNLVDGLFFIDQDVIDLAANFYNELRITSANFTEEAVEKLVPHVVSLLSKLNDFFKMNNELNHELESLKEDLAAAQNRCVDLNKSFKGITRECCEIEEMCEQEARSLQAQLSKCREENEQLKAAIQENEYSDTGRIIAESQERVATLTAERQCLMTSIEVLEADLKSLRSELRNLESQAKKTRRAATSDDLLTELAAAEAAQGTQVSGPVTRHQLLVPGSAASTFLSTPTPPPAPVSTAAVPFPSPPMKDVLLIGDSHLRYSTKTCLDKGAYIECCPGGKIADIKHILLSYVGVTLAVIYFHVGCNNLRKGYRGGPGYNGGHGKREALHSMADLLYSAKTLFPKAKIFLNSVLIRHDISYKSLLGFNSQLELMCFNFNVSFVEANCCVGRRDLSRDGVHFSRRGVSRLGSLFVDVITEALLLFPADLTPNADPVSGSHESAVDGLGTARDSGN